MITSMRIHVKRVRVSLVGHQCQPSDAACLRSARCWRLECWWHLSAPSARTEESPPPIFALFCEAYPFNGQPPLQLRSTELKQISPHRTQRADLLLSAFLIFLTPFTHLHLLSITLLYIIASCFILFSGRTGLKRIKKVLFGPESNIKYKLMIKLI
jgi:hypothetical protein